jgi:hypothetical protein
MMRCWGEISLSRSAIAGLEPAIDDAFHGERLTTNSDQRFQREINGLAIGWLHLVLLRA